MRTVVVTGTQCTAASVADLVDSLRGRVPEPITVTPVVGDTLDRAADHLAARPGPLLLIGHSLGGSVCLATLRRHPDAVAGLVLIATNPAAPRDDQRGEWQVQERLLASRGPRAVAARILPLLLGDDDGSPQWARRAEVVRRMAEETGVEGTRRQLGVQRSRVDELSTLRASGIPVLTVAAARDRLVRPEVVAAMATASAHGTTATVDASHMVVLERPREVADLVATWWASRAAAGEATRPTPTPTSTSTSTTTGSEPAMATGTPTR